MRLADRIDSVRAVVKPNGKVTHGDANAILADCKAAADVVEAINITLKMGCSGNEILEKGSAIRLAIEEIMEHSK